MPSPIAHTSLLLIATPPLRERLRALSAVRRRLFMAWLAFALLAPDLDLLLGVIAGYGLRPLHGGPTHTLLLAPVFAVLWMFVGRAVTRHTWTYRNLFTLAAAAYAAHVALDFVTPGRGVALLWPLPMGGEPWFSVNAARFGSPIPLFVGVEHSNWRDLHHHGLTVVNELGFAALMLAAGLALASRRHDDSQPPGRAPGPSHKPARETGP
ncbi:MAG: metal-dependent hydrolase [Planctomycetota bacterium]